jgi:hypothetical protein
MNAVHVFLCCHLAVEFLQSYDTSQVLSLSQLCWVIKTHLKSGSIYYPFHNFMTIRQLLCSLFCDPFEICLFQSISFIFWNYSLQIAALVSEDIVLETLVWTVHVIVFCQKLFRFQSYIDLRFHGKRAYLDVEVNEFVWNQWNRKGRRVFIALISAIWEQSEVL